MTLMRYFPRPTPSRPAHVADSYPGRNAGIYPFDIATTKQTQVESWRVNTVPLRLTVEPRWWEEEGSRWLS